MHETSAWHELACGRRYAVSYRAQVVGQEYVSAWDEQACGCRYAVSQRAQVLGQKEYVSAWYEQACGCKVCGEPEGTGGGARRICMCMG